MKWNDIQNLVPNKGEASDFQACLDAFPQLQLAKTTPQSPIYHAEGDVWTHTKMVLDSLLDMPNYQASTREQQVIVYLAALLHDIAKCSTTVIDPDTGAISQPGHSRKGAVDARIALWDFDAPFSMREEICRLISAHQVPFFALEKSRRGVPAEFIVRELSWQMSIPMLAMLAEADIRGRICPDKEKILDSIELFRELAREENCYAQSKKFADAHTAVSYFRGTELYPDYPLFQEPGSRVIVMSGLPAAGKNSWVEKNYPYLPVISFDDAREELGLRHGKNEGMVAHRAIDNAKELLRAKKSFIWNATHLSHQMRKKTLDLLFSYHAEVEIVYLEQSRTELLRRNNRRDTSLTNKGLQAMLWKWELPLPTEAHGVKYALE